jgi:hypothetical protein
MEDAQLVAGRLQKLTVRVKRRAGSNGRLFGSVGASDIASALKDAGGPDIDKRTIVVPDPIKAAGAYRVQVRLHPEVTASVNVQVSGPIHSPGLRSPQPFPQGEVLHRKRGCVHRPIGRRALSPRSRRESIPSAPGDSGQVADHLPQAPPRAALGSLASPRTSCASWSILQPGVNVPVFEHTDEIITGPGRQVVAGAACVFLPPLAVQRGLLTVRGPFDIGDKARPLTTHSFSTGKFVLPVDFSVESSDKT